MHTTRFKLKLAIGLGALATSVATMVWVNPPSFNIAPSAAHKHGAFRASSDGVSSIGRASDASGDVPAVHARTHHKLDYALDAVLRGERAVPRLTLARMPDTLSNLKQVSKRKAMFFKAVLPLVLQVNEEILKDRRRAWKIRGEKRLGQHVSAADRLWLNVMTERYGVAHGAIDALMVRLDVVPPSLALAQAATESGWGTSRFVREGNAIFGQWTWSQDAGIVPLGRAEGKTHRIRAFGSLIDSVRAYMLNINTHRAYRALRRERAALRRRGAPLDGSDLAQFLDKYSQRGDAYVADLQTIIAANNLSALDDARLAGSNT